MARDDCGSRSARVVVIALLSVVAVAIGAGCDGSRAPADSEAFRAATNRGAAFLENRNAAGALAAFDDAAALAPDSALARRNLARAHLLAKDSEAALVSLAQAEALAPDAASSAYLRGIAFVRTSRFDDAIPWLEQAVRLDPMTAAIRFQLAGAYQTVGRNDDAVTQLEETLRLDPLHLAAHYRLAGQARRLGDDEALARLTAEITSLRRMLGDEDRSREALEVCAHTQPERTAPPEAAEAPAAPAPAAFAPAAIAPGLLGESLRAAPLALDRGGRYVVVAIAADGAIRAHRAADGTVIADGQDPPRVTDAIREARPLRMIVGDVRNDVPAAAPYDPERDALADAVVISPGGLQLFTQRPDGSFDDVTERSLLAGVTGSAARFLDYDHDGDLDLAVGGKGGLALWQNDGDGRFTDVTIGAGIDVDTPVTDLAAVDLTSDGAVDLVVARGPLPTLVLEGQRTGSFARQPEPPGPLPPAHHLLVDDLDGDGAADVASLGDGDATVMPAVGGARTPVALTGGTTSAAALTDFDADGRLDLAIAHSAADGSARLRVFRGPSEASGSAAWTEVSSPKTPGLAAPAEALVSFDFDGDRDRDLWLAAKDGMWIVENTSQAGGGLLALRLQGTKSNPSGLGARVTARAGSFRAKRFVQDVAVEIGLGGRTDLDAVQVMWTNGVVDNEIDVATTGAPVTLLEKNVAAGSCPYLYAWDGSAFRFVTDLLGNAPIGLSERRGIPLPADPEEIVFVGAADALPTRAGAFVLQVTDELREVAYIDSVRLIAVDHPEGVEVHPTDRLMPPPFPASELWALTRPRAPHAAIGDDGIDRTEAVAALDGRFAEPGRGLPPQLRGMTRPLALTLDFGPLEDVADPVLALTGWLQWGDASRNIALSQNPDAVVVPPTLEMEVGANVWRPVDVVVGMPAGKTKTIVVDLAGKLAPGARRLRLRTSFEIRWDRIALLERVPDDRVTVLHELSPSRAGLAQRGFSDIRARAPGHPATPQHDVLLGAPPWETTPAGFATRFGDVRPLVEDRDQELVIMSGGDALELAFEDTLPELGPGRARTFFFHSVGWDKDEDHNVIGGTTIEPLPGGVPPDDAQRARYHTRFVPRDAPLRTLGRP